MLDIASKTDLAVLKPDATLDDLIRAIYLANKYQVASVCVRPDYVKEAVKQYHNIGTVVGFPFGYNTTDTKIFETRQALNQGVKEVDVVMNLGKFADKEYFYISEELRKIVMLCHAADVLVKVIIETTLWSNQEVYQACKVVSDSGADFIKTSTGFIGDGSPPHSVKVQIMLEHPSKLRVKASGGIKTRQQAELYLNMGCSRLGIGFNSLEKVLA